MIKMAIYGKGGIGKSTTASNLSVAFTKMGLKVMQIGCDPKADSTSYLHGGEPVETVLDLIRKKGKNVPLEDLVTEGTSGVLCVEAFLLTSGENMAIHAAANIAMAVKNFEDRGYASLGGIILNSRNVPREREKVEELALDIGAGIVGQLPFSREVQQAEERRQTVIEAFPDGEMAGEYIRLAEQVLRICREETV